MNREINLDEGEFEEFYIDNHCYCRCGVMLPMVGDDEVPFEFCSQECQASSLLARCMDV